MQTINAHIFGRHIDLDSTNILLNDHNACAIQFVWPEETSLYSKVIHAKLPNGYKFSKLLSDDTFEITREMTEQSGKMLFNVSFMDADIEKWSTFDKVVDIRARVDATGEELARTEPTVIDDLVAKDADHESRIETLETTGGGGTGGTTDHSKLINRDLAKQHPMSAIDGLQAALDAKQSAGAYLTAETDPTVPSWAKQPAKPSYTPQETGADASGTAASKVAEHNASATSHSDIRTALGSKADLVNGLIPSSQLPGYVDDVLEFDTFSALPATGVSGKVYITLDTNLTYRWGGTSYVEISASLALGETAATAYPGNKGKVAYDHSQSVHAPVDAEKNVQGDWSVVDEGSDAFIKNKPTSMAPNTHKTSHATGGNDALSPSDIGAEKALGNPLVDGYVLASTKDGVRSWANKPDTSVKIAGETYTPTNGLIEIPNMVHIIITTKDAWTALATKPANTVYLFTS